MFQLNLCGVRPGDTSPLMLLKEEKLGRFQKAKSMSAREVHDTGILDTPNHDKTNNFGNTGHVEIGSP